MPYGSRSVLAHKLVADGLACDNAQEGGDYPIVGRGRFRKFKSNFLEFWDKLINKTQYTLVYEEAFLGNLVTIAVVISRYVLSLSLCCENDDHNVRTY